MVKYVGKVHVIDNYNKLNNFAIFRRYFPSFLIFSKSLCIIDLRHEINKNKSLSFIFCLEF